MPRTIDPHILCYVRAQDEGDATANPPRRPSVQELRREHDLGHYTVERLEDLLDKIGEAIDEWVTENPPEA